MSFFFNGPATTEIYTLSLHDALPILMRFTESLAEELKERGITVNAVLPSIIDTPPNRADMPKADFGKWVKPQQLADVILFLISDQASAVTGALIPVVGRV